MSQELVPASFWRRLSAGLIDFVVFCEFVSLGGLVLRVPVAVAVAKTSLETQAWIRQNPAGFAVICGGAIQVTWAFLNYVLPTLVRGQTAGKYFLKLLVVGAKEGERKLRLRHVLLREIGKVCMLMTLLMLPLAYVVPRASLRSPFFRELITLAAMVIVALSLWTWRKRNRLTLYDRIAGTGVTTLNR